MIGTSSTLEQWRSAGFQEIYPVTYTDFYDSGRPTAFRIGAAARAWMGGPSDHSILDIGAGAGRITRHLVNAWTQVGAIEPNPDFARLLAAAAPRAAYWPSIEECLTAVGERSWDVVLSFLVLQHYPSRERLELLSQILSLSRRLALIQLPLYSTPREPARYDDVGTWSRDQLADAARSAGFVIREAREIPGEYDPAWKLGQVPPEHFYLHVLERRKEDLIGEDSLSPRRPAA